MKFPSLLILMLIFSMNGVIYLFSGTEINAQNNARREFKFYQENIRSKKKIMNYRNQGIKIKELKKVIINFGLEYYSHIRMNLK